MTSHGKCVFCDLHKIFKKNSSCKTAEVNEINAVVFEY